MDSEWIKNGLKIGQKYPKIDQIGSKMELIWVKNDPKISLKVVKNVILEEIIHLFVVSLSKQLETKRSVAKYYVCRLISVVATPGNDSHIPYHITTNGQNTEDKTENETLYVTLTQNK